MRVACVASARAATLPTNVTSRTFTTLHNHHTPLATMSGIGPELPPHLLAKRKRRQQEEAENEVVTTSGAKRSPSPEQGDKRRRVVGPAMPPAPLDERPEEPLKRIEDSDSEDDDDFGPALPPDSEDEV